MMGKQPIESWLRDQAEVATQRGYNGHYHERMAEAADRIRELEAELAALRQQQGEPVAWIYAEDQGRGHRFISELPPTRHDPQDLADAEVVTTPLYREAAPKQHGEPVAWMQDTTAGLYVAEQRDQYHTVPLYREAAPRVPETWQKTPSEIISDAISATALEYPDEWLSVTATFRQNTSGVGVIDELCIRVAAPEPKE